MEEMTFTVTMKVDREKLTQLLAEGEETWDSFSAQFQLRHEIRNAIEDAEMCGNGAITDVEVEV